MADLVYYVCFVLLSFQQDVAGSTERTEQHPARDFSRHTLVKPRIYHGREKRQISTSKDENGPYHLDHLTISLPIDGEDFLLDLTLNRQLIPKGFFRKVQQNGTHQVVRPKQEEVDLCHYGGKVRNKPGSWVALSTCEGLSGVVFDGNEMHYIENKDGDSHYMYKHSDLVEGNKTCGYAGDAVDPEKSHDHNRILRYKRAAEQNALVRGPYNANKKSKYVELVLVVDNREYKELGESTSKVEHHCKTIANIINGLYAPLNIFIALVGVVIWTEHDEISFSPNGDTTLTSFLHYRRNKLVKEHPNDNAQLLTKYNFDNGVVGKALKGPICTYEYSGGVNTDHSPVVGLVATTVAHEMGHNFGMEHDTNECTCPDDRCIMAPSSSTVAPTHWSSCSLNYLLLAFTHGMDYCLKNKPTALFDSPVCGNGFVEPGEQCDCGLPEHCDNTCCNATTCMLHPNASCATGECCDLTTCKPKSAGTLCRSADYECDLPEYCTGHSEYCPADIYKMDAEMCDGGKAFCYHGFCRTRTDQCKLLWGETGKSSDDQCYKMNIKGNRHGNCGYDKFNKSFFKCNDENVLCGMLHCKHLNERLEFGMESVSILSHSFLNLKGSIVACRTAIVDLGINQVDPGLAPDGAKCGEGKMCVNQKCMSVASLQLAGKTCPHNCNNNGWCNNLGHCHCKDGYAPPFCEDPGPGGSEDSGPASDPDARKEFVVALFVIFLGIIPGLVLIAFLTYYIKHNVLHIRSKSAAPTIKSPAKTRTAPFVPDSAKRTEDNHSLLQNDPPTSPLQCEFFGYFKGFSITPLKKVENQPARAAPPPPIVLPSNPPPAPKNNFLSRSMSRSHSFKQALAGINQNASAPTLPPPNPGSTAKPIISSPILENSTCTAKELISPLRNAPKIPARPAPEALPTQQRPLSDITVDDGKKGVNTLNRITSFLKKPTPGTSTSTVGTASTNINTSTLPRKASKIMDKNALRSIEISNPILQSEGTTVSVGGEGNKTVIMRAQSMRGTSVTPRPNIQTFGSMRQPGGARRPLSIPSGSRPKSPPPPAPPISDAHEKKLQIPSLPGYQKPTVKTSQNQYDDCLNKAAPLAKLTEELSSDNIYAVIEESPVSPPESVNSVEDKTKNSSSSNESMGLLGEIVSEIQNRNFDSIYSTSTLARKKKQEEEAKMKSPGSDTYVNTSSIYKTPESVYSNMTSSTSSGYILPSAVNPPIKPADPPKPEEPKLSTFKAKSRSPTPTKRAPNKTTISRQTTPPNLRTRRPSPSRPAPGAPKTRTASNSPDVVISCNTKPGNKGPDVVNTKKPTIATTKPNLNGLPRGPVKPKAVSFNKPGDKKVATVSKSQSDAKTVPSGVRNAARSSSNVASLQQKFENKTLNAKTNKAC
ncbi:disintegrin and metalloproteinase domain-containing protein 12 [Tribolium madens]|uniref:disintegrin and metalloproteinase domain-containing protein 12 n=1 Tax=Tribolium madens TaxID=41895 RepID=UPI001CF73852|nr:disintegrin and metalloproteinase domain-containing protein 12 [Tribolium madens]